MFRKVPSLRCSTAFLKQTRLMTADVSDSGWTRSATCKAKVKHCGQHDSAGSATNRYERLPAGARAAAQVRVRAGGEPDDRSDTVCTHSQVPASLGADSHTTSAPPHPFEVADSETEPGASLSQALSPFPC